MMYDIIRGDALCVCARSSRRGYKGILEIRKFESWCCYVPYVGTHTFFDPSIDMTSGPRWPEISVHVSLVSVYRRGIMR